MDTFLFLSILLGISVFTKGDGNVSVIDAKESGVERPVKLALRSTSLPRIQNSSGERPVTTITKTTLSPRHGNSSGSFTRVAVSSSVATVLFIFLLSGLIYYCCCRNQTPEGFTQFNNENERNPLRGRSSWKNRRFFRRKKCSNQYQNNPDPTGNSGSSTHVTVQPVLTLNISASEQSASAPPLDCRAVHSVITNPPGYDESMKNPPIPNEFINPPISNQFANPPIPSQYMNPPMPSQFMNPPMPSPFMNPPMPNNLNNPPTPNTFSSPAVRARL